MDDGTRILLVGLTVFVTHALEGITGFGCTVLALPFVALLLGIKTAVPMLAVFAWLLAGYIVLVSRKNIVWGEYLFILCHVGIGLPLGIYLFDYLSEGWLKGFLAVFMVVAGSRGFLGTIRKKGQSVRKQTGSSSPTIIGLRGILKRGILMRGMLFLGGVVHGAFVSGGPFVVVYASRALPDKSLFRVSLCLLWFTMNTIWLIRFSLFDPTGWTAGTGWVLLLSLPFLVAGTLFGDFLHRYASEYYFRLTVYGMLVVSGLILFADVTNSINVI